MPSRTPIFIDGCNPSNGDDPIAKIAGGNLLRLFSEVW